MAIPSRITLITLGVTDVARSTAFYEALGWRRSSASVDGVVTFMDNAGSKLALFGYDDLAEDAGMEPKGGKPAYNGVALAINLDNDDDVIAALDEAVSHGATLVKPATKAVFDGLSGYFADPDGHLWEVAHNPSFPIKSDGTLDLG